MDIMRTLSDIGIVPVIAMEDAEKAVPLAKALIAGGLPCAEVTFRTAAGEQVIKNMTKNCPDMLVGAGTILTMDQLKRALDAGAKFIVSRGLNEEIVKYCVDNNIPCMPGTADPSEMTKAYNMGLKVVKLFPAENLGGIDYIKACGAALPLRYMPTGGVNTKNLISYAKEEKIFACGGTWMVKKDMIEAEKWDEITKICKEAVQVLLGFSMKHIGINCNDKNESDALSKNIAGIFHIPFIEKSASNFAGTMFETMNAVGRGTKGHIAIGTNNVDRAIYHMKSWGVKFDESSRKVDEKTGFTKLIYIQDEIAGFGIHLIKN
ncbi:MAG: bifunctional 4-hydroxy-2-oxoglutarate aldolase/2-dehydro-3-deoxy-phosphogluconate aldolase [Lachnospiraceae bacterium]|nr:bifunctional 4-hydroxy-2-oxoglutarate aldolase/2-dehydro-3-deoxy-phosphogluconate aldolase [Lachnospiraceae bacterium]